MSEEKKECHDGLEETPYCTCGKCVVKRMRKNFFVNFPYNKNIASTYSADFEWKNRAESQHFYNRSKHSGFEGSYREHLPTGLMSTMKFDYKPFKVKLEEKKQEEHKILSVPFNGRTSYQCQFPNWQSKSAGGVEKAELPEIKVAFRGNSNYSENYLQYSGDFYKKREMTKAPSTLGFYGKFCSDSTSNTSFKKIDLNQPHYFNREKITKTKVEGKSTLVPPEFPKSNFESLYSQSYVDFKDKKCQLAEYLMAKQIKSLDI